MFYNFLVKRALRDSSNPPSQKVVVQSQFLYRIPGDKNSFNKRSHGKRNYNIHSHYNMKVAYPIAVADKKIKAY